MLPPGKAIEDCEGSCLAETGKNIAADYVCQARVGWFGSKLTLSAELYETAGNKLIASFNGRGANVEELLSLIESKSIEFFRAIKDLSASSVIPSEQSQVTSEQSDVIPAKAGISLDEPRDDKAKVGESIPANVNDEPSKKSGIAGKVVSRYRSCCDRGWRGACRSWEQ